MFSPIPSFTNQTTTSSLHSLSSTFMCFIIPPLSSKLKMFLFVIFLFPLLQQSSSVIVVFVMCHCCKLFSYRFSISYLGRLFGESNMGRNTGGYHNGAREPPSVLPQVVTESTSEYPQGSTDVWNQNSQHGNEDPEKEALVLSSCKELEKHRLGKTHLETATLSRLAWVG